MKNKITFFLALMTLSISAQNDLGKWKTIDDETGDTESIVEIYLEKRIEV